MDEASETTDDRTDLGVLLLLAYQGFVRALHRELESHGLGPLRTSDGYVFRALAEGPRRIVDLAHGLGVSKQAASQTVADMEARTLVRRRADPADGRATRVELTARGRKVLDTARQFHTTYEDELVERLGDPPQRRAARGPRVDRRRRAHPGGTLLADPPALTAADRCPRQDANLRPSDEQSGAPPAELGAPGRIRTCDRRIRSPVLYPAELRGRASHGTGYTEMGSHGQSVPMRTPPILRLVALAAVSTLLFTACGGSDDASTTTTADADVTSAEAWSFTDDHGTTVELDAPPATIVASPAAAGALHEYGIEVAGILGSGTRLDGTPDPALGGVDPASVEALANDAGQVNIEQLAALQPDVIISDSWAEGEYFGLTPEVVDKAQQIAPVIGLRVDARPVEEPLARFAELAESIAGDSAVAAREQAETTLDDARQRLTEAVAANPGIKVLGASGSANEMYVAVPGAYPDLEFFREAGVELVEPDTDEEFWQTLSWEEVNRYHADLILADARFGGRDWMATMIPANVQRVPAFEADQVTPWQLSFAFGYGSFAELVDQMTEAVSTAKPLDPAAG